jgi:oxalate decarboxylase
LRNLGLSSGATAGLPKKELYILPGKIPANLTESYLGEDLETSRNPHKFRLGEMAPLMFPGGWERIVTVKEFPINTTLASVLLYLEPGALREMHWHPNADEWQYYFVQQGFGHYIEQVGSEPTKILTLFNSPGFEEISISKWLAGNPASLIGDNFGIAKDEVGRLPKKVLGIIK